MRVALEAEWCDITVATPERFVERNWSRLRVSLDLGRNPGERERYNYRRRGEKDDGEPLLIFPPSQDYERDYNRGQIRSTDDEIEERPSYWNGQHRSNERVRCDAHRIELVVRNHEPDNRQGEKHDGPYEPDRDGCGSRVARPPRPFDIGERERRQKSD